MTALSQEVVIHAIVIPNYKEVVDTLRETLEILSSHPQARYTYDVYLAVEQREENVEHKALSLVSDFVKSFRSIDFIVHPYGILGESAGKGSNIAWAARRLSERYSMGIRPDVIVTGIDVDSHLSSRYFSLITSMHISHPETANTTMYSAPMIFDRNAHLVPAVVRVADILWCAAGLSGLYSSSTIAPPTSVYSLPLQLVDRVGGWDCHSEAIGEDLHMYLKCFFALNGNLTVRTVCSPVSQCNVTGGGRGKGLFGVAIDMRARYRQALRHMWGSLDTGYALRKTVELWLDRKQTSRVFRPLHSSLNNVLKDYVPRTQLRGPGSEEAALEGGIFSDIVQDTLMKPNYKRLFYLFHRLFEAHFLPVQMAILIVASTLYEWRTADGTDIYLVASILKVCKILRVLGFLEVAFYLCLYEAYHEVCVAAREKEATISGLATNMNFSRRSPRKNFIDYIMLPLVAPLYGVIPCAHAQIFHFWTLELIYTVSQKAVRRRIKPVSVDEVV
ncbi:hypothetical protein VTK73DRAFT_3288 [Phialemonium thermophilum]|uniref:Glycosyltransferase 2-like domain-containing protein n=1 Tax=Phialemonium thermophilum TaxID=223376 RepID=A0ABR3Y7L7_9PEZI